MTLSTKSLTRLCNSSRSLISRVLTLSRKRMRLRALVERVFKSIPVVASVVIDGGSISIGGIGDDEGCVNVACGTSGVLVEEEGGYAGAGLGVVDCC